MPPEINLATGSSPEPTTASLASKEEAAALRSQLDQIFDLGPEQTVEILIVRESQTAKAEAPKTRTEKRIGPKRKRNKVRPH